VDIRVPITFEYRECEPFNGIPSRLSTSIILMFFGTRSYVC